MKESFLWRDKFFRFNGMDKAVILLLAIVVVFFLVEFII